MQRQKPAPPAVPARKSSTEPSNASVGSTLPPSSPPPKHPHQRANVEPLTVSSTPHVADTPGAHTPLVDSASINNIGSPLGEEGNYPISSSMSATKKSQPTSGNHPSCGHSSQRKTAFVVVDYGATAEQGTRKTMEDQHTMLPEGIPFFGVYDGHGGTQCAEYLRDHLHGLILGNPKVKTDPERAIVEGIVEADRAFLMRSEAETNESGSVCAVALIVDDKLVVGNVGDAEAVLSRNAKPLLLTVRHNIASNPSEEERVRQAGGKVCHCRVGHPNYNPAVVSLAVTRAIGDAGFKLAKYTEGKPSGVIAVPETSVTRLTDEDEFLVIGCDGLWDVMTYAEVVSFCYCRFQQGVPAQCIAEQLAQAALTKGSTDNVTAMLVHLNRREGPLSSRELVPEAAVSTSTRNLSEDP